MGGTSPGEHRRRIEHLELLGLVARTSRFTRGARKPSAFAESQGPMAPLPGTKKARLMPRPLGNRDSEPPSHRTAPFWTPWLMALSFWSTTVRCLRPVAALDPSEPTARHFTSLKAGACDDQLAHDGAPAQDVDVRAPVRLRPGRFRFVRRPAQRRRQVECRLHAVLLSDVPHLPAPIGAAGGEGGPGAVAQLLPLHVLHRGLVSLEGLLSLDLPTSEQEMDPLHGCTSRHGRPQQDPRIITSAHSFLRAICF